MGKDKPNESVVRVAAEVATRTALEIIETERKKEKQQRVRKRLHDTKRLLRNYREIKTHADDAIASLSDISNDDYDFFREMLTADDLDVMAIKRTKARSAIMLTHIEAMLQTYQTACALSKRPEEQRRYRVLEAMCLVEEPLPVKDIADQEGIDTRTVYKDFDAACEKMGALLFGIQWIDRE